MKQPIPPTWAVRRQCDPQYAAAAVLFDRVPLAWEYCLDYGVKKAELLEAAVRTLSHGEEVLIKVALDLFHPGCVQRCGHTPASVGEIIAILDSSGYRAFCKALTIVRPRDADILEQGA
jgi:hypothetical protein